METPGTVPPTRTRYCTLAWLTAAAALAYLCRNAVGVAESSIRSELGFSLEQSGWFMGAFFWTYALFQVPSGWFSQVKGTRFALTVFALGWAAASIGIGVSSGFILLLAAQLLMGTAQAGIFPSSTHSIGHWMPLSQRSLACGILAAGMQVGAILASSVTGILLTPVGWRWVFILFATPTLLWAAGFALRFRNRPEESTTTNASERALIQSDDKSDSKGTNHTEGQSVPWARIVSSRVVWLLCGQQICRAAGYMFFASWFPTFLQETRGVSVKESGYLQGLVLAGTLTGSLLGGIVTDWIWRRTKNLRLSRSGVGATVLGTCSLLILAAWFVESVTVAVLLLALGSLFASLAGPCAFAATIDIGGEHVPQVFGLMNMCGNFAAAASPILVGMLFGWTPNWNLVLLLFAVTYGMGAVCWMLIDPQKHESTT